MSVTDSITSWMINGCDRVDGGAEANRYSETVFKKRLNPIASVRQRESLGCDGFNDDMTTTGTVGSFNEKLCGFATTFRDGGRGQTSRSGERFVLVTTRHSPGNFDRISGYVDSASENRSNLLRVRCDLRTVKAHSNLKPKENPSRGPPDLK
eukprot:scaffold26114_cov40-Cyclotella_meneghiniana.AAC.1